MALNPTRLLPEDVKELAEYGVFFSLIFNVVCSTLKQVAILFRYRPASNVRSRPYVH